MNKCSFECETNGVVESQILKSNMQKRKRKKKSKCAAGLLAQRKVTFFLRICGMTCKNELLTVCSHRFIMTKDHYKLVSGDALRLFKPGGVWQQQSRHVAYAGVMFVRRSAALSGKRIQMTFL